MFPLFSAPYYYVPYLSPLLLHISILGSGRDELDQQTELSARSDYILSFYFSVHLRTIPLTPFLLSTFTFLC